MHSHEWDGLVAVVGVLLFVIVAAVLISMALYSVSNRDRIEDLATRIEALEAAR